MLEYCDTLKLCAYMFATEKFNESEKLFESFCPLIEAVLIEKRKNSISFTELLSELNSVYGTKMHKATLQALLKKLEKEGKLKVNKNIVDLQGEFLFGKYVRERDAKEAEVNELFSGFREYMLEKDICLKVDEIKQIICNFLFSHCYDLAAFFSFEQIPAREEVKYALPLCDYILQCKSSNIERYHCFVKLYKGAVQATLLNFKPKEIENFEKQCINIKKVILDSNFVMRILDIQASLECEIAKETLHNVKKSGAEIVILKQTVEEIKQSIETFLRDTASYTPHTAEFFRNREIRFSGMYDAMKRGKTRTVFFELSKYDNIVKKLNDDFGIRVIEDYEVSKFVEKEIEELINKKNKITYQREQAIHDLTLISYCASLRKNRISDFVDAEVWVLTNDAKLTSWNHDNSRYIQACILESQLSNMMWLENPKEDNLGLVNTITTLASREMVDQVKFHKFIDALQRLKKEDDPKTSQMISLVFASDALCPEDINSIDNEGENIERIIKNKSDKIRAQNSEREKEIDELKALGKKNEIEAKINAQKIGLLTKENEEKRLKDKLYKNIRKLENVIFLEEQDKSMGKTLKWAYWIAFFLVGIILYILVPCEKMFSTLEAFAENQPYKLEIVKIIIGIFTSETVGVVVYRALKKVRSKIASKVKKLLLKKKFQYNKEMVELLNVENLQDEANNTNAICENINKELDELSKIIININTEIHNWEYQLKQYQ